MKILDTNQFIAERIQLQPITNGELEQAKEEIKRNPKCNPIDFDSPYAFLSQYIDTKILDAVDEIRKLRTKNIELEIRDTDFAIGGWKMACTLYLNSSEYCWRSWVNGSTHGVKRGPFDSAEEMLKHFATWLEKKYNKKHQ